MSIFRGREFGSQLTVSPGMCLIEITACASCRIADMRLRVSPNVFPE